MKSELRLALLFAVLLCLGLAEIASAATVSSPATTPPAPKPTSWAETNAEPLNHSPALKIDVLLIADANDYAGNGWEKDFAGDVGALLGKAFAGDYAQLYALFEFRLARHGGSAGTNCAMEIISGVGRVSAMGRFERQNLVRQRGARSVENPRLRLACQTRAEGDIVVYKRGVEPA